jgi:hypothetical protein
MEKRNPKNHLMGRAAERGNTLYVSFYFQTMNWRQYSAGNHKTQGKFVLIVDQLVYCLL